MLLYLTQVYPDYMRVRVKGCIQDVNVELSPTDHAELLASSLRLAGFLMSLSRIVTICPNFGLSLRPFSQQSNMSWCNTTGQSIGAGRR